MFKSKASAYWNPLSSCIIPYIFGIGYGFQIKVISTFLKSDTIYTVPLGLGIMNIGLTQALHDDFPVCSVLPHGVLLCTEFPYICEAQEKTYYVLTQYLV